MKHLQNAALSTALLAAAFAPAADATIAPVPTGAMVFHVAADADASEIQLPKFNPLLGELRAVRISLQSDLDCSVGMENTAASAKFGAFALGAQSTLSMASRKRPLLTVTPMLQLAQVYGPFDGNLDYSGTSGFQMVGFHLTEEASAPLMLTGHELSSFNAEYAGEKATFQLSMRSVEAVQGSSALKARLSAKGRVRVTIAYMYGPQS